MLHPQKKKTKKEEKSLHISHHTGKICDRTTSEVIFNFAFLIEFSAHGPKCKLPALREAILVGFSVFIYAHRSLNCQLNLTNNGIFVHLQMFLKVNECLILWQKFPNTKNRFNLHDSKERNWELRAPSLPLCPPWDLVNIFFTWLDDRRLEPGFLFSLL